MKPTTETFDENSQEERWGNGAPWYQKAYFEQRVSEELYRSKRYKTETTIILVRIPIVSRRAARAFYTYISTHLRLVDSVGLLGTGDYGICLPHTPQSGGEVVANRIRASMKEYETLVGIACYGEDGTAFDELFAAAEAAAK